MSIQDLAPIVVLGCTIVAGIADYLIGRRNRKEGS
jgi:hypothetical protein